MEEKLYSKINFFKKVIIITIIVLLILLFVFFMRMSIKTNNEVVDTNYDKNVELMEKAAKNYFTEDVIESDNLISLKKMYELGLIDKLKTSYKEECVDIASYAKITKLEDKYQLDVLLVCGNNSQTKTTYYNLS